MEFRDDEENLRAKLARLEDELRDLREGRGGEDAAAMRQRMDRLEGELRRAAPLQASAAPATSQEAKLLELYRAFAAAKKKEDPPPAAPEVEDGNCPACGCDLWTSEFGCPRCGNGLKHASEYRWLLYPAVFVGASVAGIGGAFRVGPLGSQQGGPLVNVALVLFGASSCTLSTWFLRGGAAGMWNAPQDGGTRRLLTAEDSRTQGIVFLVIGVVCIGAGVILGVVV